MIKAFRTRSRVSPDGNLIVPIGIEAAGTEVEVTIAPAESSSPINGLTREEWFARFDRVAGSIDDPTFQRPEQRVHAPPPILDGDD